MNLTPHEIVADLDQYVIGQQAAKRAIAISYRERSLRLSLGEDRHLITPNNILMVGPSGVGKTELARRLAEMTNAPFVKVEITNYTAAGYVGKSLDTIFDELIEHAQYLIEKGAKVTTPVEIPKLVIKPKSDFYTYLTRVGKLLSARELLDGVLPGDKDYVDRVEAVLRTLGTDVTSKNGFPGGPLNYHEVYFVADTGVYVRPAIKEQLRKTKRPGGNIFEVDMENILDQVLGENRAGRKSPGKQDFLITDRVDLLHYTEWLLDCAIANNNQTLPEPVMQALPKRMRELYNNWLERNPRKRKRTYFQEHSNFNFAKYNAISKEHLLDLLAVLMPLVTTDVVRDYNEYVSALKTSPKKTSGEDKEDDLAIKLVEERGVVFIDEIDKIFFADNGGNMNIGTTGIQRELMPFLDGCVIKTKYGELDTSNILFIASGAFMMTSTKDIPAEIMGRLPIHIQLTPLNKDDLKAVLDKPKRSLLKRYEIIFTAEGVKNFQVTEEAKAAIAAVAHFMNQTQEDTGARRLKEVLYLVLGDVLYDAHTLKGKELIIDNRYVFDRLKTSNLVLPESTIE